MANKYRLGNRFAEKPLKLSGRERAALIKQVRDAIAREPGNNSARLNRLNQFLAKLELPRRRAFISPNLAQPPRP